MPKYVFSYWEESKYAIEFEADSLEHAKELMKEAYEVECNVEELPEMERHYNKGDETWDFESLTELPEETPNA
jgi:hypothetical protein